MKKLIKFLEYAQRKKINVDDLSSSQILSLCHSVGCEVPSELIIQKNKKQLEKTIHVQIQDVVSEPVLLPSFENEVQVVIITEEEHQSEAKLEEIVSDKVVELQNVEEDTELLQDNDISQEIELQLEEEPSERKSSILRKKRNQNKL